MVQKIHPVIWFPSSRLMWENQLKKLTVVPSIYKEVHGLLKAVESALVKEELQSYMVDWPLTIQGNNSSQRFVYFCHGPVHYGANVIMKSNFCTPIIQ